MYDDRMRLLGGKQIRVVAVILVTIVVVTIGTLTYYVVSTPVDHMAVVSQDMAVNSVRYYHNTTYSFQSGNTAWLLVPQVRVQGISSEWYATLYIFKVKSSDGRDFRVTGIDPLINGTSDVSAQITGIYYYANNTVVTVRYFLNGPGTYTIDFGLKLQIYSALLFLPLAEEQIRVTTRLLVHYMA